MTGTLHAHVTAGNADELLKQFAKLDTLVCGGRHYNDEARVWSILNALMPTKIIEGGATGADDLARDWALISKVPHQRFEADWRKYGHAAGPVRNNRMLVDGKPQVVVAFPGGAGTDNMMHLARTNGIPVLEIGP